MRVFTRVNTKTSRDKIKANQMDFIKTKCKQKNVYRIAQYNTRQRDMTIALRFCFLPLFVLCICLLACMVLYYAIWFTFLCLHFVLMKSIWLAFILSRDVFVLTRIKTCVVFPDLPLLTPDEGPSLEASIFPLSFQVVREPLPFAHFSRPYISALAKLKQH